MNDFQIYNRKYSKLSLQKNNNPKLKTKNMPQGLKSILITNSNGLEISSQYANFYRNSKKNMMEDNYNVKHITYNNSNNNTKNLSFPINITSSNKNINIKYKDNSLMNQKNNLFKKKFDKFLNNSKKEESLNNYNSRESTSNNIDGIALNKAINLKINIIPKKYNFKFINVKENNISFNSNINNGKSMSKSKSKSKSKNQKESKSYNNKINNNINKMILDKYLKLYKIGEKGLGKKVKAKNANNLHKESPIYNITKNSNDTNSSDIHKMSSLNMITNIQFKGLKKKNKSSNLLINDYNKPKNMHISKTNSNIIITKIESNSNLNFKNMKNYNNKSDNINNKLDKNNNNKNDNNNYNNKSDNNNNNNNVKNNKKYLTENHIMYLMNNKNSANKKQKVKNNKEKQINLNKNERNTCTNTNTNTNINLNINLNNNINSNNNSKNNYLKAFLFEKANNESNNENIIYDYKSNNLLLKKNQDNNNMIINFNKNNRKKNINIEKNNSLNLNMYKIMNERLKTEYNDIQNDNNNNSLEIIDKMYEEENTEEINQKSSSYSHHNSFRFLYPEIYNRDDENIAENNKKINYNNNSNYSNDKKEKELDETESPLKMDTDKVTNENSGVLSFDQVKDIICYYNMNTLDKQNNFLFKQNERQLFDINIKKKYANFFLDNHNINNNINNCDNDIKNNNNNINTNLITNDLIDDIISFKNNMNLKYPSGSIFSLDTEYSSKMKKKYNKNLVKNI